MDYKTKSRITTLLGGIIGALSVISVDTWYNIIPKGYEAIIPVIIILITTATALYTEETRIEIVKDKYTEPILNDQDRPIQEEQDGI